MLHNICMHLVFSITCMLYYLFHRFYSSNLILRVGIHSDFWAGDHIGSEVAEHTHLQQAKVTSMPSSAYKTRMDKKIRQLGLDRTQADESSEYHNNVL